MATAAAALNGDGVKYAACIPKHTDAPIPMTVQKIRDNALFSFYLAALALLGASLATMPSVAGQRAAGETENRFHEAVISAYGGGGELLYRLSSPHLHHSPDAPDFHLDRPRLQYHAQSGPGIRLSADNGRIGKDGVIHLTGAVVVERPRQGRRAAETLETRDVIVETEHKVAHTGEQAVLRRGGLVTQGDGMSADLGTSEIRLLSNVRVTHAP